MQLYFKRETVYTMSDSYYYISYIAQMVNITCTACHFIFSKIKRSYHLQSI